MFHDAVFIFTVFLCTFIVISDEVKTVAATSSSIVERDADDGKIKYTTRYDKIIHNDRFFRRYIDCLMESEPCNREEYELKRLFPDAIQSECSKCSDIQRKNARKVLAHILQFKRDSFDELIGKYDPDGRFLNEHGLDSNEEEKPETERIISGSLKYQKVIFGFHQS